MKRYILWAVASLMVVSVSMVQAGEQFVKKGFAVSGYDTVAYFTQGEPVKGSESIQTQWNGAIWLFASEAHKSLFVENPEKYAPAYDGHCAYAAANGSKVSAQATAWKIIDDRLFLNYNERVNKKWLKDTDGYIADADEVWPTINDEPAAGGGWFN